MLILTSPIFQQIHPSATPKIQSQPIKFKYKKLTAHCPNMQKDTVLYLRQFFNNFLTRQQHTNALNLLHSSLEVVDDLIDKFITQHSIPAPIYDKCQRSNGFDDGFETVMSGVYGKLSAVFEWMEHNLSINTKDKHNASIDLSINDTSEITNRSFNVCQTNDEQLYQILNEYKTNNKKLKENVASLTQKLESKAKQLKEIKIGKEIADRELQYANQRAEELEEEVRDLQAKVRAQDHQINQFKRRIEQLQKQLEWSGKEVSIGIEQIQSLTKQLSSLQQDRNKLTQQNHGLHDTISTLDKQNKSTLNKKLQQIPSLIESRLNNGAVDQASIQVLMKFMKCNQEIKRKIQEGQKGVI